jgi:Trk-type K+ transport system membrane component
VGNIGLGLVSNMSKLLFKLPGWIKWALSFMMIAGRLELWTVFAIFTPAFIRIMAFRRGALHEKKI